MRARARLLTFAVPLGIITGVCWGAWADDSGRGDDRNQMRQDEQLVLKKKIDVGGIGLGAFDISFVDPKIELYVLSDRTNASVDLFDSEEAEFIGRVGATCPAGNPDPHFCFQGVVLKADGTANNNLSGPDGVVIVGHKEIWAGDGDSRIKVIDLATRSFTTTIFTGGKFRVDEMADDPRNHLLAAANNADSPPFVTLFDTTTKAIVAQLIFSNNPADVCTAPNPGTYQCVHTGVDAQNGIEQAQWSPATGLFYISVPQVGGDATNTTIGGVSVIDPATMAVTNTFLVENCTPAGLTLGPRHQALLGCSASFGTSPNVLTQSLIIDITSTSTALDGAVVASVPIGGSDEVWFDKGTRHYFLAARNNEDNTGKITPILGSIDAGTNTLDPSAPTSTTAHSVAADANAHNIFVPIGCASNKPDSCTGNAPADTDPTNTDPDCRAQGCIAVFRARSEHSDEKVSER
jgi:hypothetical protein